MDSVDESVKNMGSNVWLRILRHVGALLYYTVYPFILLLWYLLSLLLSLLGILLAPVLYIGQLVIYLIGATFRFLAKFEVSLMLLARYYRGLIMS